MARHRSKPAKWISATEAMIALGCDKFALARKRKEGVVKFKKINSRVFLYHVASLLRVRINF